MPVLAQASLSRQLFWLCSRILETWHPTAGFHCWGHVRGRKHCQCQAEFLDSPMAASFIRSVNVGQDDPDTKEFTRISFRYEGRSLQSNSVGSSAGGEGRYAQPYPSDDGEQSADLHIQKMGLLRLWRHRWPQVRSAPIYTKDGCR